MFLEFFFIGILFGNLNALAMIPLGHIAGVGAAFVGSFSSILAVPIALFINAFLAQDIQAIAYGFLFFSGATYFAVSMGLKYTPDTR